MAFGYFKIIDQLKNQWEAVIYWCRFIRMAVLNLNLKDKSQLYQLIAGLSAVTLILIGCLLVLTPFFPAMLLATIFALSTWPAFEWLDKRLKHRTTLSASLMTLFLAACFVAPMVIIGTSVVDNFKQVFTGLQEFLRADPAVTAEKLKGVSYIGPQLEKYWLVFASDKQKLVDMLQDNAGALTNTLIAGARTIGYGLLDITLGVLISFFFFRHGLGLAVRIRALLDKFGGEAGQNMLKICKNTLIGVVYGIFGTALAQAALAALGFWYTEVPGASFLGLMTFFLSLVPMGPPIIWIPAAVWLYSIGKTGYAIGLALWGLIVISAIDNFMKPYFISIGSNLPLLLVLLGVMGGILAFGFIGIFIGPTLLALAYSIILEWSSSRGTSKAAAADPG